MGYMKELFRCKDISRRTKKFLHEVIPLITVICGYETWALKEEEKRMLEVFHHGAIRRILGISRQRGLDEKITNSAVRKKCVNMPNMMNIVKRRVLKYNIGKVVREEKEEALHKSFLAAYYHSPRRVGGRQKSHRDLFIECVRTILRDIPTSAPLKSWIQEAKYESKWNALISDWWESLEHEDDDDEEDQQTESET
jgi:hypothetical protein